MKIMRIMFCCWLRGKIYYHFTWLFAGCVCKPATERINDSLFESVIVNSFCHRSIVAVKSSAWYDFIIAIAAKRIAITLTFNRGNNTINPIELYNQKIAWQELEYTHRNRVVAAFVEKPEDYLYSSARNNYGMKGLTEIGLLHPLINNCLKFIRISASIRSCTQKLCDLSLRQSGKQNSLKFQDNLYSKVRYGCAALYLLLWLI